MNNLGNKPISLQFNYHIPNFFQFLSGEYYPKSSRPLSSQEMHLRRQTGTAEQLS
jgi:hypothetical protein